MENLRPSIIAGNWKMYKTIEEACSFIKTIGEILPTIDAEVLLAVSFTALKPCIETAEKMNLKIGAQNMNDATEGAFTGEIAARMLQDVGAQFVLLGHSERRKLFHEDDTFINRKVLRALEAHILPILCVGETFEEREDGKTEEVLSRQLQEGLNGVEGVSKLYIAYEPVWAIGTGRAATAEIAEEAHAFIRRTLQELYGEEFAQKVVILYGGSVSPDNADSFLKEEDVDGLLIGSASLKTESFAKILALCKNSEPNVESEEP